MTLFPELEFEKDAWISECGKYRHSLSRHWDTSLGYALFIGLNPSVADAELDDPTIRRCVKFAKDWGYGGIEMCNLFDWRSTDPKLLPLEGAVSNRNDGVDLASIVIAAWGAVPKYKDRINEVKKNVFMECKKPWHCLKFTKDRYPWHPLYVPAGVVPQLFWS